MTTMEQYIYPNWERLPELYNPKVRGDDSILIVISLTIFLTIARYSFQNIVQNVLLNDSKQIPADKRAKFSESAWKFVYYVVFWIWGWQLVIGQDFFWKTKLCWIGWPNIPISDSYQMFYLSQLSFYIHSFLAHLTIEVKRKDFWQMLIHHVAAAFLIFFSYYHSVYRIGGVLLVLHDVNDVFLELAKMANYASYQKLSSGSFGVTLASWFVTRIVVYPIKVLYSASVEVFEVLGPFPPYWFIIFALLLVILLLNIFWFVLMVKILYTSIVSKEKIDDSRED